MIKSISIKNYRNISNLDINNLGGVNLVIGKNNVGKTSFLEAISIGIINNEYYQDVNLIITWIYKLIYDRDSDVFTAQNPVNNDFTEINKKIFSSIIHGRKIRLRDGFEIEVVRSEPATYSNKVKLNLQFSAQVYTLRDANDNSNEKQDFVWHAIKDEDELIKHPNPSYIYHIQAEHDGAGYGTVVSLYNDLRGNAYNFSSDRLANFKIQFVKTGISRRDINPVLFDNIFFDHQKTKQVEDALRLIQYNIDRFGFQTNEYGQRVGRIKLYNDDDLYSLGSMGDGINRVLTIILAMVNCQNGYILIDEFENGLHYSIQNRLWKIIFYLSNALNIQVFATTHSLDCVESFSNVLNNSEYSNSIGAMIRLDDYNNNIEATVYDASETQATTRVQIDPR